MAQPLASFTTSANKIRCLEESTQGTWSFGCRFELEHLYLLSTQGVLGKVVPVTVNLPSIGTLTLLTLG